MIAKLIVWDDSANNPREGALARMLQALAAYRVVGVANNIGFLSRLVACPAFAGADLDTGLIERERGFLFPEAVDPPREAWLVVAVAELLTDRRRSSAQAKRSSDPHSPWASSDAWRMNGTAQRQIHLRLGTSEKLVNASYQSGDASKAQSVGGYLLALDGMSSSATASTQSGAQDATQLVVDIDGRRLNTTVIAAGEKRHVFLDGMSYQIVVVDPLFHAAGTGGAEGGLVAPMPGKVIALIATPGQTVEKGAPLLILEAMKMEHSICAPVAGMLKAFRFAVGEQVSDGAELVEFVPHQA